MIAFEACERVSSSKVAQANVTVSRFGARASSHATKITKNLYDTEGARSSVTTMAKIHWLLTLRSQHY